MTTTYWNANALAIAQVKTVTINTAAINGTVSASINGKTITYTAVSGDTTSTIATNWQALLSPATQTVPELGELTITVATNVVTFTAVVPGTPFADVTGNGLTFNATGGIGITVATTQVNSSPSDVNNANNWIRNGVASLPQAGDDLLIQNASVPLLWNLDKLAGIPLNSFKRWSSFSGSVGLPEINPLGYTEWRATYLQLTGNVPSLPMQLGLVDFGSGPVRERYNVGAQQVALDLMGAGGAADAYNVRFLGTNSQNVLRILNASLAVAMLPAEIAALASVKVDGGGLVALGPGVSYGPIAGSSSASASSPAPGGGSVILISGQGQIYSPPALLQLLTGSLANVVGSGIYPSVQAQGGSRLIWNASASITSLLLQSGASLDKSGDLQPMQIAAVTMDADTCQILDPNNAITFTGQIVFVNAPTGGPILFGPNRKETII